jgi:hypothetical protein
MRDFYNPTASYKVRIALNFFLFLSARTYVRHEVSVLDLILGACVTCVKTKVLRMFLVRERTKYHDITQSPSEQFYVMSVCAIRRDRERQTVTIS